jgi:D-proline reductase (dithiol) PrdB
MRADELPLWERALIAAYRWRRVNPLPVARLPRPIPQCRVALVTTAGLVPSGALPFDLHRRGGDTSFRTIPSDIAAARLDLQHRSDAFDRAAVIADPNVAFPIEPLRSLADAKEIGSVAPRHLSFMGSITAPGRLIKEHAPAAADCLVADAVDIALLAPV